jgi:hypothetical protein
MDRELSGYVAAGIYSHGEGQSGLRAERGEKLELDSMALRGRVWRPWRELMVAAGLYAPGRQSPQRLQILTIARFGRESVAANRGERKTRRKVRPPWIATARSGRIQSSSEHPWPPNLFPNTTLSLSMARAGISFGWPG